MFTKFWDKLAEGLAGQWTALSLGPALLFWGGGLLAWVYRHGWQQLVDWLEGLNNTAVYIAVAVTGLALLTVSSVSARWMQLTVLRLVEGYWPWPFKGFRFALARRLRKKLKNKEARWQELAAITTDQRTAEQSAEYARLDAELARYPLDPRLLMPTRLGNVLRAAEEYPRVRYGLATSVCWPRLWLLLSEETQSTLTDVRERLNGAVRVFFWSILFVVWVIWVWWAVVVAIVAAVAAYWGMLSVAGVYGDLLCAVFDLHRFALYEQLRWPAPQTPGDEKACGKQLSVYLFRGLGAESIRFETSKKE